MPFSLTRKNILIVLSGSMIQKAWRPNSPLQAESWTLLLEPLGGGTPFTLATQSEVSPCQLMTPAIGVATGAVAEAGRDANPNVIAGTSMVTTTAIRTVTFTTGSGSILAVLRR